MNSYLDTLSPPSPASSTFTSKQLSSNNSKHGTRIIDYSALSKYTIAAMTQLALFSASFATLDALLQRITSTALLPKPLTFLLFYSISLRSRIFSPLNNKRPTTPLFNNDRLVPKWTPPGIVFPIVWLLLMPTLRATASTIVVHTLGRYLSLPIVMGLILHLTCGDIWNTITNVECRIGTSALANVFTYGAAVNASVLYGRVDLLAGRLLGATCVWLTVASGLIVQTWRLNTNTGGRKDSLLPTRVEGEDSRTRFWFSKDA